MKLLSWRNATATACAVVAAGTAVATGAAALPAQSSPERASAPAYTAGSNGAPSTLRITLDKGLGGHPVKLSHSQRKLLNELTRAPAAVKGVAAAKRNPYTLRCDKNPTWHDPRGSLSARFNCHHSTINWGFKISHRVKSVITGPVHEQGVSWWRNGKRQPRNAGHVVNKHYHFHGTLKPVRHGDRVQFQDYMKFRVNIGGRPGTGTLTWAADVRAKK